jgi:hypothetical protein
MSDPKVTISLTEDLELIATVEYGGSRFDEYLVTVEHPCSVIVVDKTKTP